MTINTQSYGSGNDSLYLKKIDQAFFEEYTRYDEEWTKYMNDKKGEGNNRVTQKFAGTDRWEKKDELKNPVEKEYAKGATITTFFQPFAVTAIMSREQYDDAQWGEVEDMVRDYGQSGRETVERENISVLDNAFDQTNAAIYDGSALIDNDHRYYGKGVTGTQSNLATGPLNDANLKSGLILFDTVNDDSGKKIKQKAEKLLVGTSLQFTAATLIQSSLQAGTANNDKNTLPSLKLDVLHYLTSQTSWFIQGDKHGVNHYWRVKPEFKRRPQVLPNQAYAWDGYFRHGMDVTDWRGIVGSTGL